MPKNLTFLELAIRRILDKLSGVTEQLGALSNLAMQGPPEAADRSTKVHQISNIKAVLLSAISKPVSMEVFYEGTFVQEKYCEWWPKVKC